MLWFSCMLLSCDQGSKITIRYCKYSTQINQDQKNRKPQESQNPADTVSLRNPTISHKKICVTHACLGCLRKTFAAVVLAHRRNPSDSQSRLLSSTCLLFGFQGSFVPVWEQDLERTCQKASSNQKGTLTFLFLKGIK